MKLLHHTLKYFVVILPIIVGIWAGLFYYNMVDEVEDSLDDGLQNYKMLIISEAQSDSTILTNNEFNERNYAIRAIDKETALRTTDIYTDTLLYTEYERELEPYRLLKTAFRVGQNYYELKVISSSVEKDDLIKDLLAAIIWLVIILLISILFIHNYVLKRIWAPFYALLDKIGQFSLDKNPTITPTETPVSEFKELNDRVVELANSVVATYNSQKQFLENASHEMQTPLAISLNKLELLAEEENLSESQILTIEQIAQQLKRLTRLNKTLLVLTKIENRQFMNEEVVNLNALINDLMEQFEDLATAKSVNLTLQEEVNNLNWVGNPDLLHMLFSNLIKNALVHSQPEDQITVEIKPNSIQISNTGAPLEMEIHKLFERFQKSSSDTQRLGLGLAIVKAICEVSGLEISYLYEQGRHNFKVFKK